MLREQLILADGPTGVTIEAYPDETFSAMVRRIGLAVGRKQCRSDDWHERLHETVVEMELGSKGSARASRSGTS